MGTRIGARETPDISTAGGPREQAYLDLATLVGTSGGSDSPSGEGGATGSDDDRDDVGPNSGGRTRRTRSDKGQKRGPKGEAVSVGRKSVDVDAMAFSLSGIHATLAMVLHAPEIALDKERAEYVAKSYANFARHYEWLKASEKTMDTGALMVCIGVVYLPMMIAVSTRRNAERQARRAGMSPAVVAQPVGGAPTKQSPLNGAKPTGVPLMSRPRTEEDNALLNEAPIPMPTFN